MKYMPRGVDGHVEGLMQYSREEVWYKLGKLINQLDADEVFFPETNGFVVSSIIKGKIIIIYRNMLLYKEGDSNLYFLVCIIIGDLTLMSPVISEGKLESFAVISSFIGNIYILIIIQHTDSHCIM